MDHERPKRRNVGASWGERANATAHSIAQRVDDTSGLASRRLASALVLAVRVLRFPTAIVAFVPAAAILATFALGAASGGVFGTLLMVVAVLLGVISAAFIGRRRRILQAIRDPELLAGELQQMFNLTGRLDDGSQVMRELTAGGDGARVFGRLRSAWRGVTLPSHWIDQISQLRRARYFAPPKIGTTVLVSYAAVWLIPISLIVAMVAVVGTISRIL